MTNDNVIDTSVPCPICGSLEKSISTCNAGNDTERTYRTHIKCENCNFTACAYGYTSEVSYSRAVSCFRYGMQSPEEPREFVPKYQRDVERAYILKVFTKKLEILIGRMVDIMFSEEGCCQIDGCRRPDSIPCDSPECVKANKEYWYTQVNNTAAEVLDSLESACAFDAIATEAVKLFADKVDGILAQYADIATCNPRDVNCAMRIRESIHRTLYDTIRGLGDV